MLIAKRSFDREIFPRKWECGGGQVHTGEDFETAIRRQFEQEFGISIKKPILAGTYAIPANHKHGLIPGLTFICPFNGYFKKDLKLNKRELSTYKWIAIDQVDDFDFIRGLGEEIKRIFKTRKQEINELLKITG